MVTALGAFVHEVWGDNLEGLAYLLLHVEGNVIDEGPESLPVEHPLDLAEHALYGVQFGHVRNVVDRKDLQLVV
jgi:hypothetical protein